MSVNIQAVKRHSVTQVIGQNIRGLIWIPNPMLVQVLAVGRSTLIPVPSGNIVNITRNISLVLEEEG